MDAILCVCRPTSFPASVAGTLGTSQPLYKGQSSYFPAKVPNKFAVPDNKKGASRFGAHPHTCKKRTWCIKAMPPWSFLSARGRSPRRARVAHT